MRDMLVHDDPLETDFDPARMSRRRFLSYATGVLSAIIAAALGIPLARFYVGNALSRKQERWLKLGDISHLTLGQPQFFHSSYIDLDGWRQMTRQQTVYVVTTDGSTYTVFSNACTHLGCPVHWDEHVKRFLCPCHGGGFSLDGSVVAGPAPRPLDRLEHKVESGVLYVHIV